LLLSLLTLATLVATAGAGTVVQDVLCDAPAPQCGYATRRLGDALADSRVRHPGLKNVILQLSIEPALGPEAFSIKRRGDRTEIKGGDARGMIYGALAVREQLLNGLPLNRIRAVRQKPALAFRGIKFNTPWDSYRPSSALGQHYATVRDLKFWEAYLDMMVENRFNAVSLWTMHPFTYMIRPKNFPEASKWTDAEFAEWQHLYREVFRMAKERGLDTYVVFWSIFVSPEFAKAHNPASRNFYPHYYVEGDTSAVTRRYLRESVTQMLEEYPDLDGIGVSHGEGMAGMTPLERQQFVDEVYVAGALEARKSRPVKLIHRVPFSSGLSSGPGVSADVEKITRAAMEKLGDKFEGPIWVEMKFNWSHGHSTPKLVKVHGGKLGDTYFKPAPSNYKVVWQVRNEDFFALRWGAPDFIRQHLYNNARKKDYVGGYFVGSETYIPALDYFTAVNGASWRYAFERQWLFYKVWGRLLYDSKTKDSVFEAEFTRRYGAAGAALFAAYSEVSWTPLTLASFFDSRWDFTLYSEGVLALQGEVTKYIGVDALIDQPTLDPNYVSIKDYVTRTLANEALRSPELSPLSVANHLEKGANAALTRVRDINTTGNVALMYEVADVKAWANIALHLAEKIRGGVELQFYRVAGGDEHQQAAITHLTRALAHWDELIRITRPIYKDMPLTHYNGNSFDANPNNLFHWALVRDEVARDIEVARRGRE
jgi:hypothetical protein